MTSTQRAGIPSQFRVMQDIPKDRELIYGWGLLPPLSKFAGWGRWGTLFATIPEVVDALGLPTYGDKKRWYCYDGNGVDGAGKVTAEWVIWTPRGPVDIHDYWSNDHSVLSLGHSYNGDARAARWLRALLRERGLSYVNKIVRSR